MCKVICFSLFLIFSCFVKTTYQQEQLTTFGSTSFSTHSQRLTVGPISISEESNVDGFLSDIPRPKEGLFIVGAYFELIGSSPDGLVLTSKDVYVRDLLLLNLDEDDFICKDNLPGRVFATYGSPLNLSYPYVYPTVAKDHWGIKFHLKNLMENKVDIYINYTIEYTADPKEKTRAVYPFFFDVSGNCKSIFSVPGEGSSVFSKTALFSANFLGTIISATGYMNIGGLDISLTRGSDKLCDSIPHFDDKNHPFNFTQCSLMEKVQVDDILAVVAVYDNKQKNDNATGYMLVYADVEKFQDPALKEKLVTLYWPYLIVIIALTVFLFLFMVALLTLFIVKFTKVRRENRLYKPQITEEELTMMSF